MKRILIIAALALLIGFQPLSVSSKNPDDFYAASVYCDNLNDMNTLVDLLNEGNRREEVTYLLAIAEAFKCYLYQTSGVSFFPVKIIKVIEHRGARIIYEARMTLRGELGSNPIYVFSMAGPEA